MNRIVENFPSSQDHLAYFEEAIFEIINKKILDMYDMGVDDDNPLTPDQVFQRFRGIEKMAAFEYTAALNKIKAERELEELKEYHG